MKEIDHKAGIALVTGNMGVIYWSMGELEKAVEHHKLGLAGDTTIGNKEGAARHWVNLGNTYKDMGNFTEAIKAYDQSKVVAFLEATADPESRAILQYEIWRLNGDEKYAQLAEDYFRARVEQAQNPHAHHAIRLKNLSERVPPIG